MNPKTRETIIDFWHSILDYGTKVPRATLEKRAKAKLARIEKDRKSAKVSFKRERSSNMIAAKEAKPAVESPSFEIAPPEMVVHESGKQQQVIHIHHYQEPSRKKEQPGTSAINGSVLVLLVGFIIAFIPGIGLSMWILAFPVCLMSFVLAIVGAAQGMVLRGIFMVFVSVISFFLFAFIPVLSTLIGAGAASH